MGIPTEIAPNIATEIDRIKSGVSAAYTAVKNKGVTTSKTKIADLAGEISKIKMYDLIQKEVVITENGTTVYTPDSGSSLVKPKAYDKFTVTVNVGGSSGGGHTITFDDGIYEMYGAGTFTISITTSDGSTTTLDDAAGKSYANVTKVSFSDNDDYETYTLTYKMPPNAEASYASTPCTITLTDDAEFISLWK